MKTILLTMESDSLILPVNYSNMIQGMIYSLISDDSAYAEAVHDHGFQFEERKYKLFTFGSLKGRSRYADKKLYFNSDLQLEIRFVDDHMAELAFRHLQKQPVVRVGSGYLNVISFQISETMILQDQLIIRMAAPLTIHSTEENGHTHYYSPDEPEFRELIIQNIYKKYLAAYRKQYIGVLDIVPVNVKPSDKIVTSFKGIMITGWKGDFCITADRELLKFLYYAGLGDRNSQGFGMFEII